MAYRRTPAVQARLDAQRAAIVQAAHDVLAEHGYRGCTMAAVAARAGIATGTIYRHFPSKSALAVELFRTVVDREVAAVAEASASGEVLERVVAVTETFARRALKAPRLAFALLAEPVDPAVDEERLVYRRAFRDIFAQRIAEGVSAGVLPPQDPQLTAAALVGAVAEALLGPLSNGDHPDIVPAMATFTLRALGVQHATHP
ncbi:TetR/AcrR family transcriptional regulator [Thermocrispum municipale]|jgi:AcrR family transcriptional regulator|uniref:TetR/AcrR family transcriptional regulator n=1 Tax=Thermocrispum municipale TaxID=37926 RepID=UPI0004041F72|nr:TetR/AcrR family transcriptional regulator [Thermocrispum municipale]